MNKPLDNCVKERLISEEQEEVELMARVGGVLFELLILVKVWPIKENFLDQRVDWLASCSELRDYLEDFLAVVDELDLTGGDVFNLDGLGGREAVCESGFSDARICYFLVLSQVSCGDRLRLEEAVQLHVS